MGNAKHALELSKLDQENLRLKIEAWQKASPQSSHYFRPYIKKSHKQASPLSQMSVQNPEHVPDILLDTTGSDDNWVNFKESSVECSQTLLDWQK